MPFSSQTNHHFFSKNVHIVEAVGVHCESKFRQDRKFSHCFLLPLREPAALKAAADRGSRRPPDCELQAAEPELNITQATLTETSLKRCTGSYSMSLVMKKSLATAIKVISGMEKMSMNCFTFGPCVQRGDERLCVLTHRQTTFAFLVLKEPRQRPKNPKCIFSGVGGL